MFYFLSLFLWGNGSLLLSSLDTTFLIFPHEILPVVSFSLMDIDMAAIYLASLLASFWNTNTEEKSYSAENSWGGTNVSIFI